MPVAFDAPAALLLLAAVLQKVLHGPLLAPQGLADLRLVLQEGELVPRLLFQDLPDEGSPSDGVRSKGVGTVGQPSPLRGSQEIFLGGDTPPPPPP